MQLITFTPREDGQGYDFTCPTLDDKLFSGIAVPRPSWMLKTDASTSHIGVEDTFDGHYGRLLERADYGLRVKSPAGNVETYFELPISGDTRRAA
jgi:hypothetical protein